MTVHWMYTIYVHGIHFNAVSSKHCLFLFILIHKWTLYLDYTTNLIALVFVADKFIPVSIISRSLGIWHIASMFSAVFNELQNVWYKIYFSTKCSGMFHSNYSQIMSYCMVCIIHVLPITYYILQTLTIKCSSHIY
jgi:hypothetical protein